VFLLRLSPVFPFSLLNYALGLTSVRFGDYLAASVGMLPGTLLYVYSGKAVGDVAALAGGAQHERGASDFALLAVGLIATAVGHRARDADRPTRARRGHERGLGEAMNELPPISPMDVAQPGAGAERPPARRGRTPSPRRATTWS
jgi:hypothetical protein